MAVQPEPTPPGTNARGRASRQRLLEAAAACFGESGYSAVRVSDITARAGMSQGGFYRHFADKPAILLAALDGPLDELLEATAPITASERLDPDAIRGANLAFFTTYARHRRVFRVLREAAAQQEPGLAELWLDVRARYVGRIEAWLTRLQAAGAIDVADPELLADALGSSLDQLAYTRLALARKQPTRREIARLGEVTGELWVRALRP